MPIAAKTLPSITPVITDEHKQLNLCLPTLKVASYKGPGQSGGVPASLEPVIKRLGTKIHWFSVTGNGTQTHASESQSNSLAFYTPVIAPALLTKHDEISSGYLYPLLHGMPDKAKFDHDSWKSFRQVSEIVASEILKVSSESFPTLCWLHDYQLALVAPLMSMQAGVLMCQFWHVPFPSADIMKHSPIARELVESLLSNRLLGFHTTEYAINFLNTVQELLPNAQVDMSRMEVRRRRSTTRVVVMPLGIDFSLWQKLAKSSRPLSEAIGVQNNLANQVILGVDRLDYCKGVLEKLAGLECFLEKNPNSHRRFHYVQIAQEAQSAQPDFTTYVNAVKKKVSDINRKYGRGGWTPIVYIAGHLEQSELSAWYQAADVLAVNSIRDGLNLIAKEYVASRLDEQGVLLLSKNAGCAIELSQGAMLVDPLDPEHFAQSLSEALSMTVEEKRRRMSSMQRVVCWNQVHDWAIGFLQEALAARTAPSHRTQLI